MKRPNGFLVTMFILLSLIFVETVFLKTILINEHLVSIYEEIEEGRQAQELIDLRRENNQLRCNTFYRAGDKLLIPPTCEVPLQSQGYGITKHIAAYGGMGLGGHPGIDWAMDEGTPIRASHGGQVFESWEDDTGKRVGYGGRVKIRQRTGQNGFETVYAHLSKIYVKEGEQVRAGQLIGLSGDTGFSSRPHLHFGIRFLYFCDKSEQTNHPCEVIDGANGLLGWVNPIPHLSQY